MELNQIYRLGKDCAKLGGDINSCPYKDRDWERKRAWVLGFIEGLREVWALN